LESRSLNQPSAGIWSGAADHRPKVGGPSCAVTLPASLDLFGVRTISFKLLYGLVILRHARGRLVTISVTSNPTAEWIAGQVTDAFPWGEAPNHLIRDRDAAFGPAYTRRIRAMGIRDHPMAPRSPWQKATSSGSSDQYVANVSITWWCSTKRSCVAF
jgi:hypothetical protein